MKAFNLILLLGFLHATAAHAQAVVEYVGLGAYANRLTPVVGQAVEAVTAADIQKLLSEPQPVTFTVQPQRKTASVSGDAKATSATSTTSETAKPSTDTSSEGSVQASAEQPSDERSHETKRSNDEAAVSAQ